MFRLLIHSKLVVEQPLVQQYQSPLAEVVQTQRVGDPKHWNGVRLDMLVGHLYSVDMEVERLAPSWNISVNELSGKLDCCICLSQRRRERWF